MANQTKYLDSAGVAQLYKRILDQLDFKLDRSETVSIIKRMIEQDKEDSSDEIVYLYGGSASELV